MEKLELSIHKHPLLPITRVSRDLCNGCEYKGVIHKGYKYGGYIYGGYRCNELGCQSVFHRECAESLPEINHSLHPDHPLKLLQCDKAAASCSRCGKRFENGYTCSICDFKLDLRCAKGPAPLLILENFNLHEHQLELFVKRESLKVVEEESSKELEEECKWCQSTFPDGTLGYGCKQCDIVFHAECAEFFPEANHTFHPQHPLKLLTFEAAPPDYGNEKCLLCGIEFYYNNYKLHHCDVCNFNICSTCMQNPPPVVVDSTTTHEHPLHLVPRRIKFTCNACGTKGDGSPYFCLQCNFMIHRECIDLPRVININRHDHRISYTSPLVHRKWNCKVCRKEVVGFYGAYTCVRECPSFAVHSLCATRKDVWDMLELEGMPEEEVVEPFEKIDANTIKHFSHGHNLLRINKDDHDKNQPENIVCEACLLQILSEPFYSCKQCDFFLHEKCANHPLKKRHVCSNQPFRLFKDSHGKVFLCSICDKNFTGFRYEAGNMIIDVRCAAISDTLQHKSHPDPLYFDSTANKRCSGCGGMSCDVFSCDVCDYTLDRKCTLFPNEVMKNRYDDHPLFLSFGEKNVDGDYWCEACETKVDPKNWFYTCIDCGTTLHTFCVVGDFSYIMPGTVTRSNGEVVSNTSVCRPLCFVCNFRCKLPSILKISSVRKLSKVSVDVHICSFKCRDKLTKDVFS